MNELHSYLKLSDGRQLTYSDQGNQKGTPMILLHGAPGHCLFWNQIPGYPFEMKNYRFIAVDRRGYGTSDYKKGTTYSNYVKDIKELMDHLQIQSASVLGVSGGGPFALGCAYGIPDRVRQVVLVNSVGPTRVKKIENALSKTNQRVYKVTRKAPWLMNLNMRFLISLQKKSPMKFLDRMSYKLSEPDQKELASKEVRNIMEDIYLKSNTHSWRGYASDVILQSDHWDFDLSTISTPVIIFQANQDTSCPIEVGEYFAQNLPNGTLYNYDNAGHLWGIAHFNKVLDRLEQTSSP